MRLYLPTEREDVTDREAQRKRASQDQHRAKRDVQLRRFEERPRRETISLRSEGSKGNHCGASIP